MQPACPHSARPAAPVAGGTPGPPPDALRRLETVLGEFTDVLGVRERFNSSGTHADGPAALR
jgi:hypothetical protein